MPITATLRIAVFLLATASGLATARACNEECTEGFVFSGAEGVCVRADAAAT